MPLPPRRWAGRRLTSRRCGGGEPGRVGLRRVALRRVCPGQAQRSGGAFPDHVGCRTLAADQSLVAIGMHYTYMNLLAQGKLDEAITIGEEGVAMCRQVRNLFIGGTILNSLAEVRRQRRELA